MAGKKEKKGFFGSWIVRNLLMAFAIVVVLIAGAIIFLNVVTKHNQELVVPDFTNLSVEEASVIAEEAGMRIEVTDSVFVKRMQKGAVYRQNPSAGDKVKNGRRIVLTIRCVRQRPNFFQGDSFSENLSMSLTWRQIMCSGSFTKVRK